MNQQAEREQLEDVLHAFLAEDSNPDYATLNEWVRRYPYYRQELTEFSIARNLINTSPEPVVPAQAETELITFGKGVIQSLAGTGQDSQAQTTPKLTDILTAGRAIGLRLPDIANRTRLSAALIRKLDRRLIPFATLPREVVEVLGLVLQQKADALMQYLQLPPTFAAGASYRAEQTPQLAEPEDFATALRNDPTISQEDRDYWLDKVLNS